MIRTQQGTPQMALWILARFDFVDVQVEDLDLFREECDAPSESNSANKGPRCLFGFRV